MRGIMTASTTPYVRSSGPTASRSVGANTATRSGTTRERLADTVGLLREAETHAGGDRVAPGDAAVDHGAVGVPGTEVAECQHQGVHRHLDRALGHRRQAHQRHDRGRCTPQRACHLEGDVRRDAGHHLQGDETDELDRSQLVEGHRRGEKQRRQERLLRRREVVDRVVTVDQVAGRRHDAGGIGIAEEDLREEHVQRERDDRAEGEAHPAPGRVEPHLGEAPTGAAQAPSRSRPQHRERSRDTARSRHPGSRVTCRGRSPGA